MLKETNSYNEFKYGDKLYWIGALGYTEYTFIIIDPDDINYMIVKSGTELKRINLRSEIRFYVGEFNMKQVLEIMLKNLEEYKKSITLQLESLNSN